MFHTFEITGNMQRRKVATATTLAEAETNARATYRVVFFEVDEDNGDCADFITADGGQFAIEPEAYR